MANENEEVVEARSMNEFAESLLEKLPGRHMGNDLEKCETRLDFARIAAQISEDRYSGGSTGAIVALYISIKHGYTAAGDFAADLEHHEN